MKYKHLFTSTLLAILITSCNYLDIVPDNIATLEMAFNTRANAEKYLATCYNFVPAAANLDHNSGLICGGEMWYLKPESHYYKNITSFNIARGMQNSNDPLLNYWDGGQGGYNIFRGIHECNIFIDNIDRVPDMRMEEKNKWKAEVMTLKAYYIYYLMLHYGPIPLLKENISVEADLDMMQLERETINDIVTYTTDLLDEAMNIPSGLTFNVTSPRTELGRITLPIAKAIKAKLLILAASPLFNGNTMYAEFVNSEGIPFFDQEYKKEKWEAAAAACLDAINTAHEAGASLYKFDEKLNYTPSSTLQQELTLRNTITGRFNSEIIWALGSNATDGIQNLCQAHLTSYSLGNRMIRSCSQLVPSLEIVEQFYTANGVPMDEDKDYEYENRYKLTTTPEDDPIHFTPNYTTIKMHLNREPRFYAYIGFDGGKWFSIECCNDNETSSYPIKSKKGDIAGVSDELYSPTGYFTKKLVSYQNVNTSATNINYVYSFPIIRLSDLYLLYAEALNELNETPTTDVYYYVQQVRNKAGLDEGGSLVNTWRNHSNRPDKPTTQRGMREIIQKERMIELAFEGHRYHDVRRWKLGSTYLNTQIKGWSVLEQDPEYFYNARVLFTRKFMPRDYLWPLKTNSINRNPKLVQNPPW